MLSHAVADTADSLDQRTVRAQLLPQRADMHIDRAGFAFIIIAPDILEQHIAREHGTAIFHQQAQQLVLLERPSAFLNESKG